MSNLSNQYISSSYSALLNLAGAGAVLTSTPSVIQDGTGQSSPLQLSTTEVVINGTLTMSGSVIPATSGSYDIGSSAKPFRHIYASSGSIYLDDHQILSLGAGGTGTSLYAPPSGSITFENDIILNNNSVEYGSTFNIVGTGPYDQANVNFNATTAFVQNSFGTLAMVVNTPGGETSGSLYGIAQNGGSIQFEAFGNDGTGSVNLIAHSGSINLQTYSDGNIAIQAQESGSVGINSAVSVEVTTPKFVYEGGSFEVLNSDLYMLGGYGNINLQSNLQVSGSFGGGVYGTVDTLSGTTTGMFFGMGIGSDLNNGFFGPAYSTYQNTGSTVEAAFYGPGTGNNDGGGGVDDVIFKLDATVAQGTPNPVKWYRNTDWTGDLNITGSLGVTNIKGTGSLYLQPNQGDSRFLEVYNTSPTDTHITASGGQLYLGNDVTYVKVDNYGTVKHIDIVADNGVNISGSVQVTGSLSIDNGSLNVPSRLNFTTSSNNIATYINGEDAQITIGAANFDLTTTQLIVQSSPQYPNVTTQVSSSFLGDGIFNSHLANYDAETIGFAWSTYNSIPENSLSACFYGPGLGNNPSPYGGTDNVVFSFATGSNVVDWYRDTVWNGTLDVSGSLTLRDGLNIASGSNKTIGTVALNGGNPGTATVSNSLVTSNSIIFLTKQTNTNSGNGTVSVTSKGTGTFSITSDHNGDTDVVAYQIINPA